MSCLHGLAGTLRRDPGERHQGLLRFPQSCPLAERRMPRLRLSPLMLRRLPPESSPEKRLHQRGRLPPRVLRRRSGTVYPAGSCAALKTPSTPFSSNVKKLYICCESAASAGLRVNVKFFYV